MNKLIFYFILSSLFLILKSSKKKELPLLKLKIINYDMYYNFIRSDSTHYKEVIIEGAIVNQKNGLKFEDDSFLNKLLKCKQLEALHMHSCSLKTIPYQLSKLKKLKYLNLEANKIDTISVEITKLTNLTFLDLSYNQIKYFNSMCFKGKLTRLKYLHLANNKLENIPKDIYYLENIRQINLSYNNIHVIPCSMSNLQETEINLDNNRIKKGLDSCFCKRHKRLVFYGIPKSLGFNCSDRHYNVFINPE